MTSSSIGWYYDNVIWDNLYKTGHSVLPLNNHDLTSRCNTSIICNVRFFLYMFVGFNFSALAQGNAYKPTKETINYRGPGGDRTHDLQTEATPPAASCPARTLHATEIASKKATPMICPRLYWTTDNPSGMITLFETIYTKPAIGYFPYKFMYWLLDDTSIICNFATQISIPP